MRVPGTAGQWDKVRDGLQWKTSVKFIKVAPPFVVTDVMKTAEFYRDSLGFKILDYFLDPPVYAMVERDDVEIHFGKA